MQEKINVLATNTRTDPETAIAQMLFTLEIGSVEQLSRILDKISRLPNITDAHRQLPGSTPPPW